MPKISSKHMDGRNLIKMAEKAGLEVKNGKGDHANVYGPEGRGYMTIPARPIGRGLACSIVKWLVAAGVTISLSVICYIYQCL